MSKTSAQNTSRAKNSAKSSARQRLIETAERLFYAEGIHAVGIDRIIAEAEVAKMTLYNHFASKDDLILAVLEYRDSQINAWFQKTIDRNVRKGMGQLDAFFATLKSWFRSATFRGCAFINASVELADSEHPASKYSREHKVRFGDMIRECVVETGGESAAKFAPSIALLVEGATVAAVMQNSSKPAEIARDAAFQLIGKKSSLAQ